MPPVKQKMRLKKRAARVLVGFVLSFGILFGALLVYRIDRSFRRDYVAGMIPIALYLSVLFETRCQKRTVGLILGLAFAAAFAAMALAWWTPMEWQVAIVVGVVLCAAAPFASKWLDWF